MKRKLLACTVLVFALAIGWAGCGSSGGDVCVDAAKIMLDGMKEACNQQSGCCYCDCLAQNKVMDTTDPTTCNCIDGDPTGGGSSGGECTGEAKSAAEQCLNDTNKCKSDAGSIITTVCSLGG